jgi:hypothetical protein
VIFGASEPCRFLAAERSEGILEMSPEAVDGLAERANVVFNQPHFLGCTVRSYAPVVLAYRFASAKVAVAFEAERRQIAPPHFRYLIDSGDARIVLEFRAEDIHANVRAQ